MIDPAIIPSYCTISPYITEVSQFRPRKMMRKEDRKTIRRPFGSGKLVNPNVSGHFFKDSPRITTIWGEFRNWRCVWLVSNFARSLGFLTPWKNQHLEANVMEVDGSDDFPDFNCMIRLASSRLIFPGCKSATFIGPVYLDIS